nr:MAG TPA: hypothetical protein [Caudoviricetes sp.]
MRVYKAAQQASSRRKFHILKYELLIVHRRLQGCIASHLRFSIRSYL